MTAVIVTPSPDGRHTVRFRYDAAVVATIKQSVPGYARSWDAQRRRWLVDPDWIRVLAAELRRHGHTVTGVEEPAPRQAHRTDADWAQQLFRRVGAHRADPVFRALARVLHPDVATGDAA
jgi:hypothetical protein